MFEGIKRKWTIIKDMFVNSADLLNNEIDIYKARVKESKENKENETKDKRIN